MNAVIKTEALRKRFGRLPALDGVSMEIAAGSITGLVGANGAGKTTLLRALLGLNKSEGGLQVLGLEPRKERSRLLRQASFIADTAVLPAWIRVEQLVDYAAGIHPGFCREKAEQVLAQTAINRRKRIRELSKGMVVQVHLALVLAIEARLMVLDEPTLGLDIMFRKLFFEQLVREFHHEQRTILIATHQVEEVESILSDVIFMAAGRIVLHESMESLSRRFTELHALGESVVQAQALGPLGGRTIPGGKAFIFEDLDAARLQPLGELHTPSLADLFVAKLSPGN